MTKIASMLWCRAKHVKFTPENKPVCYWMDFIISLQLMLLPRFLSIKTAFSKLPHCLSKRASNTGKPQPVKRRKLGPQPFPSRQLPIR